MSFHSNKRCESHSIFHQRWNASTCLPSIISASLLVFCFAGKSFGEESTTPNEAKAFESAIRADAMRAHIEFLAGPKLEGRSGAAKEQARQYILERFRKANLKPLFQKGSYSNPDGSSDGLGKLEEFLQPIPGIKNAEGKSQVIGYNIGAFLPGSDPNLSHDVIIVGAHYDHLGVRDGQVYSGADDNASGVAMLLEVASHFASREGADRPKRSMVFVAFDLEEHLLWGSRWFVSNPPLPLSRIKFFVTADMIGRSLGNLDLPAVFVLGSEHSPEIKQSLDRIGSPKGLEVCRLGTDLIGTRSDYGPFRDREIPFLFFSTGEHPDYHTPRDTPEKIDYPKAARIAGLIMLLLRDVASSEKAPEWKPAIQGDLDEPQALLRVTELLLDSERDKSKPLTSVQRFMVTNVRNRTRQILRVGSMSEADRAWLIHSAQLLMLSVF